MVKQHKGMNEVVAILLRLAEKVNKMSGEEKRHKQAENK